MQLGRLMLGRPALVCLTLGACSLGSNAGAPAGDDTDDTYAMDPNASVVDVVDGDTLVVEIDGVEERVRLIGIDTPETVAPNRPVECYGKEATERTEDLVPPGTPIRLERDIEARDQYERLLAYVYRADDGLHVNLDHVVHGYAAASSYPPNTALQPELDQAESRARRDDAGLWGVCGGPDVPVGPPPGHGSGG